MTEYQPLTEVLDGYDSADDPSVCSEDLSDGDEEDNQMRYCVSESEDESDSEESVIGVEAFIDAVVERLEAKWGKAN